MRGITGRTLTIALFVTELIRRRLARKGLIRRRLGRNRRVKKAGIVWLMRG
jgi:hypothetical protein